MVRREWASGALPPGKPFDEADLRLPARAEIRNSMESWRFQVEVPEERPPATSEQHAKVGREQRAADAALEAVE